MTLVEGSTNYIPTGERKDNMNIAEDDVLVAAVENKDISIRKIRSTFETTQSSVNRI